MTRYATYAPTAARIATPTAMKLRARLFTREDPKRSNASAGPARQECQVRPCRAGSAKRTPLFDPQVDLPLQREELLLFGRVRRHQRNHDRDEERERDRDDAGIAQGEDRVGVLQQIDLN